MNRVAARTTKRMTKRMTKRTTKRTTALATALATGLAIATSAGAAAAQCRPPTNSNEAKLLAFYEAPIAFSPVAAPTELAPGTVRIEAEVVPLPTPDPAIQQTHFCFLGKSQHTDLAPVFGRPRISLGLPGGLVVEASYLPPITIGSAQPNLASFALSEVRRIASTPGLGTLTLLLRGSGTMGLVRGPITCSSSALQTADASGPCFGTTPSRDTFHPNMFGGEGALGLTTRNQRWSFYAGGGVTLLRPRFQVGFTDGNGIADRTQVDVDLARGTVFGGITAQLARAFELSAQLYSVPADATTWRFGAGYRLR